MKKKFNKKTLHDVKGYKNFWDLISRNFSPKNIFRTLITLLAVFIVLASLWWGYKQITQQIQNASSGTLSFVNKVIWTPMEKDIHGNINILILGYGWMEHKWGFLTDSMMVASFNPQKKAVTMLSIPRDLFINKDNLYKTKINALLPMRLNEISNYSSETIKQDFAEAEDFLREKIEDITWLSIPYYVGVSFKWFQDFIDELWGLTIDVPQTLNDPYFPDDNTKGYEPLIIKNWIQIFNGETALKYARSRQTTSDFSRSYRQQQIISALITQIKATISRNKLSKIESLYELYKQTVYTNISLQNALAMSQHRDNIENLYSFVFSYECASSYELMNAWCFLYTPDRETFWGAAVLLPQWADASNVSYYKWTQDFVYFIINNQQFLNENAKIRVENAIDKVYASSNWNYRIGRANTLAKKLKQYGFTVYEIDNAAEDIEKTIVHTYGKEFEETTRMLELFIDFDHIHHDNVFSGDANVDINIQLGNDFIMQLNEKTHQRLSQ